MSNASTAASQSPGLTTLAMLKANFDAGQDHIGMFLPFIVSTIKEESLTRFSVQDLRQSLERRHAFQIPNPTIQTLLGRAVKKGFVRRELGQFIANADALAKIDITKRTRDIEREHAALAKAFREYSEELNDLTDTDALTLILDFIREHELLLLTSPDAPTERWVPKRHRQKKLTARFIRESIQSDPQLAAYLERMLQGYVLQNVLLLKEIGNVTRRFRTLRVYFDTRFLFRLVGLEGPIEAFPARELLDLLRETGADVGVFQTTIREMRSVLRVHEDRLRTPDGILTLKQTPLARHFLNRRYAPSDVREASVSLETDLKNLGIRVHQIPSHEIPHTLDEADLTKRLMKENQTAVDHRIEHDVDCAAAIVTLRKGRKADSWDDGIAVFMTTTGHVVQTVTEWYEASGEGGLPPIIHYVALSNYAWLKKPARATKLKLHQLVAVCVAAIRPSEEHWNSFKAHVVKLQAAGKLKADEAAAIMVSQMAETLLGEVPEDGDRNLDATTLDGIIDRVKAEYADEAHKRAEKIQHELEKVQAEAETARKLELNLRGRAARMARILMNCAKVFAALLILAGIILSVSGFTLLDSWVIGLCFAPFVLLSVAGLIWGHNLLNLSSRGEAIINRRLRRLLFGLD